MTPEPILEQRVRAGLRAALDGVDGPHPVWATAPAATRAPTVAPRRPWRSARLLAVAAILLVGAGAVAIWAALPRRVEVGATCPTLEDYAAASAAPSPAWDRAPGVDFPAVAPTATQTPGLQPLGTWIVVADADGPKYQIRLRDPIPCDRLPDARSEHRDGTLVLATADIQQLRPGGVGPWVGMSDRFVVAFGEPPVGGLTPLRGFGIPGTVSWTDLRPRDDFSQTSLVIFDLIETDARIGAYLQDIIQGDRLDAGWILRDGVGSYDLVPTLLPQPGATATTGGPVPLDSTVTVADSATGTRSAVTVGGVDEVERYPAYVPSPGMVVVEAFTTGNAWSAGLDPAVDWPDASPPGALRWQATDADGAVLRNLGDDRAAVTATQTIHRIVTSDNVSGGYLVFEAPADGPVRLALLRDGVEVAWWSLRD